jgi:diguanylate cyclase (GGDEF)-like protein
VLRRVADRLRQPSIEDGFSGRLGGDEFAVIVPCEVTRTALDPMVQKLLRDLQIVAGSHGQISRVSGTVGIAWSGDANGDRDMLLRQADAALYAAKRSAKGTAQTFTHVTGVRSVR